MYGEPTEPTSVRGRAIAMLVMPSNLLIFEGVVMAIGGLVMTTIALGPAVVNGAPFDDIERISVAEAIGNSTGDRGSGGFAAVTGGVTLGVATSSGGVAVAPSTGAARKIHDVRPIWPDAARRAGIQG